ncbi:MAG: hypothetical protein JWM20_217 [Patescibacteria group bacterium]|nr:hypothetical protein [Patescibacteria group bacterium]
MNNQYFIAPIGHEIIVSDNGNPLKKGSFGIFEKVGNIIYHVSEKGVRKGDSKISIPLIGDRNSLEETLKRVSSQSMSVTPFHSRFNRETVYYHAKIGLVTRIAA